MNPEPEEQDDLREIAPFMPRWVAMLLAAPAVLAVVGIAYFVAAAEIAHDDERCPFFSIERREVSKGIAVLDEGRRCQPGVAEHRWLVDRQGAVKEIGRRRLHDPHYERVHYRWRARITDGVVHVDIENGPVPPAHFREPPTSAEALAAPAKR